MDGNSRNRVISSINDPDALKCVDFFQRPDGSFGYEEYRRDHEDLRGWFPVGGFSQIMFATLDDAQNGALRHIVWFGKFKDVGFKTGSRSENGCSTPK
jgi:hypothetical protein